MNLFTCRRIQRLLPQFKGISKREFSDSRRKWLDYLAKHLDAKKKSLVFHKADCPSPDAPLIVNMFFFQGRRFREDVQITESPTSPNII